MKGKLILHLVEEDEIPIDWLIQLGGRIIENQSESYSHVIEFSIESKHDAKDKFEMIVTIMEVARNPHFWDT